MMYRGPSENSQNKSEGMFGMNMAFSKDILKSLLQISKSFSNILVTKTKSNRLRYK